MDGVAVVGRACVVAVVAVVAVFSGNGLEWRGSVGSSFETKPPKR